MEVVGSTLYSVNRASLSVNKLDLTESKSTPTVLCDDKCLSQITNPFDLAYDSHSNQLYILDASYHPSLPTYQFSIKSIKLADGGEDGKEDFDNRLSILKLPELNIDLQILCFHFVLKVQFNEDHGCHKYLTKQQSFDRTTLLDNNVH